MPKFMEAQAIIYFIVLNCFACCVQSKVITVNNDGNISTECCQHAKCPCGSLYSALRHLENDSILIIASESVTLDNNAEMGSGYLHSIVIASNGASILCNNKGGVYCKSCSDVQVQEITWDRCNITLTFRASSISIVNCVFKESVESNVDISGDHSLYVSNSKYLGKEATIGCEVIAKQKISVRDGTFEVSIYNSAFSCFEVNIIGYSDLSLPLNIYTSSVTKCSSLTVDLYGDKITSYILIQESVFQKGCGSVLRIHAYNKPDVSITVTNSRFVNNNNTVLDVDIGCGQSGVISLDQVWFQGNKGYSECVNLCIQSFRISNVYFESNSGKVLHITIPNSGEFAIENCKFSNNTSVNGALLHMIAPNIKTTVTIKVTTCIFDYNIGEMGIVYFQGQSKWFGPTQHRIILESSNFTGNNGSALSISSSICTVAESSQVLFEDNTADNGGAIEVNNGCLNIGTTNFTSNHAKFYGGAIFFNSDDSGDECLSYLHPSSFSNNSASIAGNTVYINSTQAKSKNKCNTINCPPQVSPYHIQFDKIKSYYGLPVSHWNQLNGYHNYELSGCYNDVCHYILPVMLGLEIHLRTTVRDYYSRKIDNVYTKVQCTNCTEYTPTSGNIIEDRGIIVFKHITDINDDRTMHFSITTPDVRLDEYQSTTLIIRLQSCFNGYVFDINSKECSCYLSATMHNVIQCQKHYAEIKQGYWFGTVSGKHTVSICPNNYCQIRYLSLETEFPLTSHGYHLLPIDINDQCGPHREGAACSNCKENYSLAYSTPRCVSNSDCTRWTTALVITLTILYWITIILIYSKFQIPLEYLYGIMFYYSIVDDLLDSKLDLRFSKMLIEILSSLTKLSPPIFGSFCFIEGLSGIDQQVINYIHVIAILLILFMMSNDQNFIRTFCILLLLSYTSLTSTSIQLLKPLTFDGIDGYYCHLSPTITYFSRRHVVYFIAAILCLFFVVGFPSILFIEPFLRNCQLYNKFDKIRPLLNQFQGSYRDKWQCFVAYYLTCRLVVLLFTHFVVDFQFRTYCILLVFLLVVPIHYLIKPYKSDLLNMLDTIILVIVIVVLIANLEHTSTFIPSAQPIIIFALIIIPFILFWGFLAKGQLMSESEIAIDSENDNNQPIRRTTYEV
ncbi:uncharacterized protein [Dysidea avara]|uniref:uncharacterized protein n=1 Tax=Dysidea avara TaxID=196820 RepID=UPI00332ADCEC